MGHDQANKSKARTGRIELGTEQVSYKVELTIKMAGPILEKLKRAIGKNFPTRSLK